MKTIYTSLTCFLLSIICLSTISTSRQSSDNKYLIIGKIKGLHSGKIKLVGYAEDERLSKIVDSSSFKNDSFVLKGKLPFAQMLTIVIDPGNWSLPVFIENSVIKIEGDTSGSEHYDWTAYGGTRGAALKFFSITGSKSQDDWVRYMNDASFKKYDATFKKYQSQIEELSKTDVDSEYKVMAKSDSLKSVLQNDQLNYIQNYQAKNPSSVVGVYILSKVYSTMSDKPLERIDSILNKFNGDAQESVYYKRVASIQQKIKALLPGHFAPDFTLLKRDGSAFKLSTLRGNYSMIDFWASWCYPCRQAIPHWKKVYNKYHSKGFEIVSVSSDSRRADWCEAMDIDKMPWHQVCDEFPIKNRLSKVNALYMTPYIPFYVLLDKDGNILVYSGKEGDIDKKLKQIFGI